MSRKGKNIYKRNDGRWEGRYACRSKGNGNKRYVSIYGNSYKDVKNKLIMLKARNKPQSKTVMFDYAAEQWLVYIKFRVKVSTLSNYTYLVKRHILPYFKNKKINELNNSLLNSYIDFKLSNGKLNGKGGISKKYMQDILYVVKSIAVFCENEYGITNNIHNIHSPKPEKAEPLILTDEETKLLTVKLSQDINSNNMAILLSMYTGIRIGEVCALHWEDYDCEKKTIHIKRTIQRISNNKGSTYIIEGTPKTSNSLRTIPLPDFLCKLLDELNHMNKNSIAISGTEPSKLRKYFKEFISKCGIKDIRYHDLRHNFASVCIRKNFDIKALSEILGHANASVTLDRYVHTNMDIKRQYMNLLSI